MPLDVSQQIDNEQAAPSNVSPLNADQQPTAAELLWKEIKDEEEKTLADFSYAKPYLNELIGKWIQEEQRTEANRLTRDIDIDVDQLREVGDIEDDECFIPERIIDSNIQREMPSYINFLKNSRRIGIFNDVVDATFDASLLEDAYTKGMTYKGWTKPWFKVIDGSMTHGWAAFEVVYDENKPLNVGLEYIAHEDLLFPTDSKDIQSSSVVLRKYKATPLQLKTWCVKFGFNIIQVNRIIEKYKEKTNKDKTITVFKRFCKHDGVVYVSWFSMEGACDDWLKAPAKLSVGISELQDVPSTQQIQVPTGINPNTGQPVGMTSVSVPSIEKKWVDSDVKNYPVFLLFYKETEKPLIFEHYGRVFYDKDKQEAQTAIVTAFVNGLNRAQKIYASPAGDAVNDGKPAKQLANIKWSNGTIFDKPMEFWNMPYPDPMILKALEYFDVSNSQDIGQTDFAAVNRQDSRKTAREITASEKQQMLLDSVDLTIFSEFCREVLSFAWLIARSQALQNKIKFLQVRKQSPTQQMGASGMPAIPQQMGAVPMQQQMAPDVQSIVNAMGTYQDEVTNFSNDYDTLIREFEVRSAGDVDVIQKAELVQQMAQDWPVVQTTPLAGQFLCDLMKLKYPQDGKLYSTILLNGDPKVGIIKALATALQGMAALPEVKQHLTPEMIQGLQQLEAETKQVLGT